MVYTMSSRVLPRSFLYLKDVLGGKVPVGKRTQYHRLVGQNVAGVELAANNPVGSTLMHMAALTGDITALEYCLACGFGFHQPDRAGITANDLLLVLREPNVMKWMYQNQHLPVMPKTLSVAIPSREERIEKCIQGTEYILYSLRYPYGYGSPLHKRMLQLYRYPLYENLRQHTQDNSKKPRYHWLRAVHQQGLVGL